MANPNRRGQVGSEVSTSMQGADYTPWANTSFVSPYGLNIKSVVLLSTVTGAVAADGVITYTTSSAHQLAVGQIVTITAIAGFTGANLASATVGSVPTSTTFTITNAATGTYTSGGLVTPNTVPPIPSGITFVYAICVGAGAPGTAGTSDSGGGGGGGVAWGWTIPSPFCIVANASVTGGTALNCTQFGNIIAGSGGASLISGRLGGGGGGGGGNTGTSPGSGSTNYYGMPGGRSVNAGVVQTVTSSYDGAGGAGSAGGNYSGAPVPPGGSGISGGGGASATSQGGSANYAGAGGSGLVGGGGGYATGFAGFTSNRQSGAGGNGFNILTGTISTGGTGQFSTITQPLGGGGGAGVAGNGGNGSGGTGGNGGLGGGGGGAGTTPGTGGNGILFLYY